MILFFSTDYFASTATANDSFVSGTAGAGYAYLNQMSSSQLETYGERVGRLTAQYGPHVVDTVSQVQQLPHRRSELKEAVPVQYGYANISVHEAYAAAITKGGSRPAAFVTQANYNEPAGDAYAPYRCPTDNMALKDGTPIICSSGTPKLFYCESPRPGHLRTLRAGTRF